MRLCCSWLPEQNESISIHLNWYFGRLTRFHIGKAYPCLTGGRDGNFLLQPAANNQPRKPSHSSCKRSSHSGLQGLAFDLALGGADWSLPIGAWRICKRQAHLHPARPSSQLSSFRPFSDLGSPKDAKVRSLHVHTAATCFNHNPTRPNSISSFPYP